MKSIKRLVAILRGIGVTLLLIALALTIYMFASSGSLWGTMKDMLNASGANSGIITRLTFNADVYGALSDSIDTVGQSNNVRNNAVAPHFASYLDKALEAEAEKAAAEVENTYAYFENDFDGEAFLESYARRSSSEDEKELTATFETLNTMLAPAGKGGKKLPAVGGDCRPEVEAFYAAFVEENGEDVGSLLDFAKTIVVLLEGEKAAGTAPLKVMDYLNSDAFNYDVYMEALPEVQNAEQAEATVEFIDAFAALVEKDVAGEEVDYRAFFEGAYEELKLRNPDTAVASYEIFVVAARGRIDAGVAFDGTYSALYTAVQSAESNARATGANVGINNLYGEVISYADENSEITIMEALWTVCQFYGLIWLLGIVMLIVAKVTDYFLSRALINRRERRQIVEEEDVLLRVNNLKQYFRSGDFVNKAVDDVSFYVKKGEVFGLVGESGCGKTTTGRTIINLYDPTDGDVYFQGLRISSNQNGLPVLIRQLKSDYEKAVKALEKQCSGAELSEKKKELKKKLSDDIEQAQIRALESSVEKSRSIQMYRDMRKQQLTAEYEADMKSLTGKEAEERTARYKMDLKVASKDNIMTKMQMIFQDPIASINPRMTVREIIAEGMIIRGIKDKKYIDEKVNEMLELVGLVREHADRYPHEFSGGQRQRIGIARAIVLEPDLIIADEPISALDVSIQAQVINLLNELRNKMGLTIMFIAHNLSVVKYFSDRIAVMYFGKIVEMTTSDELFEHPLHPYTKSLLSAIPYPDPHYEKQRKRIEYNPTLTHDYTVDKPSMREITPGHFIYCNDKEEAEYKKELGI